MAVSSGSVVTVEIPNLAELQAKLEELGVVKIPRAMRKVIVAGAKPIRTAIRAETPIGPTGNLKKSVKYKSGVTSRAFQSISAASRLAFTVAGGAGALIGPQGSPHAHLVIDGHEMVGHKPNLTRTGKMTRSNPFVQRGRETSQDEAMAAMAEAVRVVIEAATVL
jgi:hypothetical protein